jgi:hypothetical protein
METPDSSHVGRMKTTIISVWQRFAFQHFLNRICSTAIARAHWLALGLLVAVGMFSFWTTSTLTGTLAARKQVRMLLNELRH